MWHGPSIWSRAMGVGRPHSKQKSRRREETQIKEHRSSSSSDRHPTVKLLQTCARGNKDDESRSGTRCERIDRGHVQQNREAGGVCSDRSHRGERGETRCVRDEGKL